ncbi:uncharacterized protein KY384_000010 [Bacidia gigantensis]|uniref:uncharacterized protein n=1 Tax=Bacidia gigantensis TaxID=2732470 RepID=UPI001D045CF5|nr:uncharacterized protein KY384_000010 [Bacidia gigantensis]KAG8526417.1 hypothetical protein KY384_000010 [Bacidia gigantensis]
MIKEAERDDRNQRPSWREATAPSGFLTLEDEPKPYHLRAYDSSIMCRDLTTTEQVPSNASVVCALGRGSAYRVPNDQDHNFGGILRMVSRDSLVLADDAASILEALPIRFKRIREMIDDCCTSHHRCTRSSLPYPQNARLIDCSSRKIVTLKSGTNYLALSYVWGQAATKSQAQHSHQLIREWNLPNVLPQTINDAIQITIALGFQYLWIDRYCIQQHQASDKARQIQEMANVYSNASATICALGKDDETGIPGISVNRKVEFAARVQGMQLAWSDRRITSLLKDSVWSTRGWTLQEAVCSPRCLFFTQEQVVMACALGTFSENPLEHASIFKRYSKWEMKDSALFGTAGRAMETTNTIRFEILREEYMRRKLGYDTDVLNAFQAIFYQLNIPSHWGLVALNPVSNRLLIQDDDIEDLAIRGLCWNSQEQDKEARRCEGEIPSWSWLTQYSDINENCYYGSNRPLFLPEISVIQANQERTKLAKIFVESISRAAILEISKTLEIVSVMAVWSAPRQTRSQAAVKVLEKRPRYSLSHISDPRWGKSAGPAPGQLYLDSVPSAPAGHILAGMERAKPRSGYAMLMHVRRNSAGFFSAWLLVQRVGNGSYRRQGVILEHEDDRIPVADDGGKYVPPVGSLRRILLR